MKNASEDKLSLHCYASGDGCLSFTWLDSGGKAGGRVTTKQEALNFLRRASSLHLRRYGFRVYRVDGNWVLARKIETFGNILKFVVTVEPDAVRPEPEAYAYEIREPEKRPYIDSQLQLRFRHMTPELTMPRVDNQVSIDSEWFEVKNQSIRLAVLYYLNHRDQLDLQEGVY